MKYVTVSESLRQNGDRHQANGWRYLTEGKPSFARGSFRKAERNYARADYHEFAMRPAIPSEMEDRIFAPMIDRLQKAIVAQILGS